MGFWSTLASQLVWIVSKIHQLQTLISYGLDRSRYHGRAAAVKNQRTVVRETMTIHKLRAATALGAVANEKGIVAGLGKTSGSRPAE